MQPDSIVAVSEVEDASYLVKEDVDALNDSALRNSNMKLYCLSKALGDVIADANHDYLHLGETGRRHSSTRFKKITSLNKMYNTLAKRAKKSSSKLSTHYLVHV